MSTVEYQKARENLTQYAERCRVYADTGLAIIAGNPNVTPPYTSELDPERFTIVGGTARKVLGAITHEAWINPEWIATLKRELAGVEVVQ